MNETELGRSFFYFFIGELGSILLAIFLKEDKRLMVLTLVFGSVISGYIGFGRETTELPNIVSEIPDISESSTEGQSPQTDKPNSPTEEIADYTEPSSTERPLNVNIIGDGSVTTYFETAKALGELSEEKYSLEERNRVNQTLTFTIKLSKSQPVVWRWYWCATTRNILDSNLKDIDVEFILNGEDISDQFFSTYFTFDGGSMDGWACYTHEAVLKDWSSGVYRLQQNATFRDAINDGKDSFPAGYKIYDYTLTVP